MAQHDMTISNADGATVRADINSALEGLTTCQSGASAPSPMFAFQLWADTANTLLKQRNAANTAWITIGPLDTAQFGLLASGDNVSELTNDSNYYVVGAGLNMAGAILQGHGLLIATLAASANLTNSHRAAYVRSTSATALTLTIQPQASFTYTAGFQCVLFQAGAGTLTIQADTGVTLNGVSAGSTTISEQRQSAALVRNASDNWDISGSREDVA